jgi:hypothetical protein
MAYDPTKPLEGAPLDAAEMRSQFAGLADGINGVATQLNNVPTNDAMTDAINDSSAANVNGLAALALTVSSPPTQAQVQAVVAKLNELIAALKR